MASSLASDLETIFRNNQLSDVISVQPDIETKTIYPHSKIQLQIKTGSKKQTVHGSPENGVRCDAEARCFELSKQEVSNHIDRLFTEIENNASNLIQLSASNFEITSKPHFRVQTCQECAAKGKINCTQCRTTGKLTCRSCSGAGQVGCTNCHGHGQMTCRHCNGSGQVAEYQHSSSDGLFDTVAKNHGYSVNKDCGYCNRGLVNCARCNGSRKVTCGGCSGGGSVTCGGCSGAGQKTCTSCAGNGHNSKVTISNANVIVTQTINDRSKFKPIIGKSMARDPDAFFECTKVSSIDKSNNSNDSSWHIEREAEFETLNLSNDDLGEIEIGCCSNDRRTLVCSKPLDQLFLGVAEGVMSGISSLADFKEKSSQFPEILRILFDKDGSGLNTHRLGSLYHGLISIDGLSAIKAMKDDFVWSLSEQLFDKIFWPLSLILGLLFGFFGSPMLDFNIYIEIGIFIMASIGVAFVLSHFAANVIAKSSVKIRE